MPDIKAAAHGQARAVWLWGWVRQRNTDMGTTLQRLPPAASKDTCIPKYDAQGIECTGSAHRVMLPVQPKGT
jgi:hypothetical protein